MAEQDTTPDEPAHTPGTNKGEEQIATQGKEAGRDQEGVDRTARDSTSVGVKHAEPIDPKMPKMPPA